MPYTPAPDYTTIKPLKQSRRFRRQMDRAIEIKETVDALGGEYDDIRDDLEPELRAAGVQGCVIYNGYLVGIVEREEGAKLNKKKLIAELQARGIDLSVIDAAMDPIPASTYVVIRRAAEKPEEAPTMAMRMRRKSA